MPLERKSVKKQETENRRCGEAEHEKQANRYEKRNGTNFSIRISDFFSDSPVPPCADSLLLSKTMMTPKELTTQIKLLARECGFDEVGVTMLEALRPGE